MIPLISQGLSTNVTFLVDFALKNEACMLDKGFSSNWKAIQNWVKDDGSPDLDYLVENYGYSSVPVLIGESSCDYTIMALSEFVDKYLRNRLEVAYLKDWHFQSQFPDAHVYDLPAFLSRDWINNEKWTLEKESNPVQGDYRFVYIGAKGSWTNFHSDVMGSFSWSANICGRKLWYMLRPGMESHFQEGSNFVQDIRSRRELWEAAKVMEDSISINHNVINAYNIDILVNLMEERLADVKKELRDVEELGVYTDEEFQKQCQSLLLADFRMNSSKLIDLMDLVILSRSSTGTCKHATWSCPVHSENIFECKKDSQCLQNLKDFLMSQCYCTSSAASCNYCLEFVNCYELSCASTAKKMLIKSES